MIKQKKGHVWVETVLYTLIGLAVIGLLLAVARPKIAETQDDFVVKQTINALNELDNKILEVKQAVGNRRVLDLQLSKGSMIIDVPKNIVYWKLESSGYMLSEPGAQAYIGKIAVLTTKNANKYDITLSLNYSGKLIFYLDGENKSVTMQPTKTPYKIVVENIGDQDSKSKIGLSIS